MSIPKTLKARDDQPCLSVYDPCQCRYLAPWILVCNLDGPGPRTVPTVEHSTKLGDRGEYQPVIENLVEHSVLEFEALRFVLVITQRQRGAAYGDYSLLRRRPVRRIFDVQPSIFDNRDH